MSEITEKLKNKKLQKNIIIYLIIFFVVIFVFNWLIKSGQASRNKNQAEKFNAYYKRLLAQCGKSEKIYSCCFNSVSYLAANNYKLAGIGCEPGFKLNTFNCEGSFRWCEMIR